MAKKNSNSGNTTKAVGVGMLIGGIIAAGVTYFLTKNKEETKETKETTETSDSSLIHAPPPLIAPTNIPEDLEEKLVCPISLEVMTDPVVTPYGHTYERKIIEEIIEK